MFIIIIIIFAILKLLRRFHGVMFSNFLNLNYLTVVILKLLMFSDQKAVDNSYMPQFLFHCV
jgi:hypothetical protein